MINFYLLSLVFGRNYWEMKQLRSHLRYFFLKQKLINDTIALFFTHCNTETVTHAYTLNKDFIFTSKYLFYPFLHFHNFKKNIYSLSIWGHS